MPMTEQQWRDQIAGRRAPQVPAVTPQQRVPEDGRARNDGPTFNADAVVAEGLKILLALGARREWIPEGRTWLTAALGYDPSTGELITFVPAIDGGPAVVERGPDAIVAVARRLMEKHRILLLGPDPAAAVKDLLRSSHGWDPAMTHWYVAGHLFRGLDARVRYRPRTPDAETGDVAPVRVGGDELIGVAAEEIARVIADDIEKANA